MPIPDIDLIERQRDIQKYVYPLREQVFVQEQGYPYKDNLVMCEEDAVSNHYVWLLDGEPAGVVSVANITGLDFLLDRYRINPDLRVANPHKFAVPGMFRGQVDVRMLLGFLQDELQNYDFVTAYVTRPSNNPDFTHHLQMAAKYERLFGLKPIGTSEKPSGAPMLVLGRHL